MVRRLRLIVVVISAIWLATPALAQTARATGSVRDSNGRPIMGATIRAAHPDMPRQVISTSDSKGRWVMLGLRVGTYTFIVGAPGFIPFTGEALVRTEGSSGRHSEVLTVLLDHVTTCLAMVVSQAPADEAQAAKLEDALVRRAFALCEALLREATTASAAAYDPAVIRRHIAATIELAATIHSLKGA